MTHLNIEKISLVNRDRIKEEQKKNARKRTLLLLIHDYLENSGCMQAAEALRNESRLSIAEYNVCDNINLEIMLQDFESYYFLKYQKLPCLIKKMPLNNFRQQRPGLRKSRSESKSAMSAREPIEEFGDTNVVPDKVHISSLNINNEIAEYQAKSLELSESFENHSPEWKAMANLIMQDFSKINKSLSWSDVIGHEQAKQLLKEAAVYPLKYPQLFPSASSTWKSILLYGPSGTGKTLLATVAAILSKAAFFNINISTLVSKWRGESEKLVKVLFDLAKLYAPSVIFIDEIDALMSHRGCDHEASRRMKTEFFLQMDALMSSNKLVLFLGASNMPWELDTAILRRMEKRIFISLPDTVSRYNLFEKFLSSFQVAENVKLKMNLDYGELAKATENYSASDIELVCKEVKMNCFREIINKLENYSDCKNAKLVKCVESLEMCDVLSAIDRIKPASTDLVLKYIDWKEKHGSE
ncbi:Katanin p60 ATPase-containing subunit A-like 2 [Araneus ventricosus]|uniref:Katanin p60 ATPase-containing subunit A-like 2 n=1 Tax=Araneus ventricosus TaxID=182803 RepID=A0A4Y2F216_ARAVE|nr:Katanin p60 ATPase-containing subunit A-like 2 [Araneus ventricosus]